MGRQLFINFSCHFLGVPTFAERTFAEPANVLRLLPIRTFADSPFADRTFADSDFSRSRTFADPRLLPISPGLGLMLILDFCRSATFAETSEI